MPLSEHEQRMLDEIESALYAEDPKFVSSVSKQRVGRPDGRRRWQAALLLLIGLGLLVGGIMVDVRIGEFPIISLVGFFVMFAGGLLLIFTPHGGSVPSGGARGTGAGQGAPSRDSFSSRMEDRFNKRFDQDGR
ncbi:MAG: DUF3040 domain-containing protein [Gordonia sp. (in: high G+C Gram-positive bacteria)]|uniref:DUF3040 domain-containing protein n=1 Tax=Gordonia sp. (in: high G+C Gram-positive bacteria) TaxID=84139 RepID=UPI0039E23C4F